MVLCLSSSAADVTVDECSFVAEGPCTLLSQGPVGTLPVSAADLLLPSPPPRPPGRPSSPPTHRSTSHSINHAPVLCGYTRLD